MRRSATWLVMGLLVSSGLVGSLLAQGNSASARQAAQARRAARVAERIARQPNPRAAGAARRNDFSRRDEHRRGRPDGADPAQSRPGRQLGHDETRLLGRDNALRRQLAAVDRLRDKALLTGDEALLDRANELEQQIIAQFDQPAETTPASEGEFGEVAADPLAETDADIRPLPPVRDFERGLGRQTARQVRGLEPLPEDEHELGAPGFGRRTAAERRYLRGQDPRGPWDAQYWPMPSSETNDPPAAPQDPTADPTGDPTTSTGDPTDPAGQVVDPVVETTP